MTMPRWRAMQRRKSRGLTSASDRSQPGPWLAIGRGDRTVSARKAGANIAPMVGITLRGVTKRYPAQRHPAVDGVDLELPRGQLTALLGPSGCGKTTMLRLIAGLERIDDGRIAIGNDDVTEMPAHERPLSLVVQNYALFPHLSAQRNVEFGLLARNAAADAASARALEALDAVGLADAAQRRPGELSGGQQQRVALARALVIEPAVLLFDEPLSNLDTRLRRRVRDDIRALQQRQGLTVVYVTHDQTEALAVSDRIVVMRQGRVVQCGSPREVYERPVDDFVADFMGDTMLLPALVDGDGRVRLGPLTVPVAELPRGSARDVTLAVRPHAWQVRPASQEGLPARVLRSTYLGHAVELRVASDFGELLLFSRETIQRHSPGAPVTLTLGSLGVSVLC
jgi:iron(III) transport system ATP-binding protein